MTIKRRLLRAVVIFFLLLTPTVSFASSGETPGREAAYDKLGRAFTGAIEVKRIGDSSKNIVKVYNNGKSVYTAKYPVKFHIDKGNVVTYDLPYGEKMVDFAPVSPKKSGYTFVGWRINDSATSTVYTPSNSPVVDSAGYLRAVCRLLFPTVHARLAPVGTAGFGAY